MVLVQSTPTDNNNGEIRGREVCRAVNFSIWQMSMINIIIQSGLEAVTEDCDLHIRHQLEAARYISSF